VDTVTRCRAAGGVGVPQAGGDDENFSFSADGQQPLEVSNRRRHGDFVYHHELAYDMVFVVGLVLGDGRQGPVLIGAAEAAVVKAVDHHWHIRGESGAIGLHLREYDGDRGGGEDPTPPP
jgi:hypothetical protein